MRLRDPAGKRTLQSAAVTNTNSGGGVRVAQVDAKGECVVIEVSRDGAEDSGRVDGALAGSRTVAFALTALLH